MKSPFIDAERRFNVVERTFNVAERPFNVAERRFNVVERKNHLGLATNSINGSNKFILWYPQFLLRVVVKSIYSIINHIL